MKTTTWMGLLAAAVAMIALIGVGGCAGGKLGREIEAAEEKRAAVQRDKTVAADDVKIIREAIEAATDPETRTVDWGKAASTLNKSEALSESGRATFNLLQSAGLPPPEIVKGVRKEAADRGKELLDADAALEAKLRELKASKKDVDAREDAAWDLGGLGVSLLDLVLPGAGLIGGALLGRARGIAQGKAKGKIEGATQAAQLVASARVMDPKIDAAFENTTAGRILRRLMADLDPEVKAAIDANKTTPLEATPVIAAIAPGSPPSPPVPPANVPSERGGGSPS